MSGVGPLTLSWPMFHYGGTMPKSNIFPLPVAIQAGLAALVLLVVALTPPANGFMLILPLTTSSRPVDVTIRAGALLVSAGPVSGSVIVRGKRNRLIAMAMADNDIVISTGSHGCAEPRIS